MINVLIIGATSAIARETARIYAQRGANLLLVGRNEAALTILAEDLTVLGAGEVNVAVTDLLDTDQHSALIDNAVQALGSLDVTLIAHGILGDQEKEQDDYSAALNSLNINCLSGISLLMVLAQVYRQQGTGTIAVISSPAGDRGRQSNYVYGTAKAALTVYTQGLRNRLFADGVQVLTIKPGFVITPMTAGFKKGLLWVKPNVIARGIVKAVEKKKDEVYLPWFWTWIMLIIRNIPEFIFKRLKL